MKSVTFDCLRWPHARQLRFAPTPGDRQGGHRHGLTAGTAGQNGSSRKRRWGRSAAAPSPPRPRRSGPRGCLGFLWSGPGSGIAVSRSLRRRRLPVRTAPALSRLPRRPSGMCLHPLTCKKVTRKRTDFPLEHFLKDSDDGGRSVCSSRTPRTRGPSSMLSALNRAEAVGAPDGGRAAGVQAGPGSGRRLLP